PLLSVWKELNEDERNLVRKVFSKVEPTEEEIERVRSLVLDRGGDGKTFELAREYVERAKELLKLFPDSDYRRALSEVADFIVERTY
ncbi:MAG: polyprenyl synthetase family protein, partial [Thermovibrio sp.]